MTISTSVGKYLHAGELREKTHHKSKETHSSIQGKMHQPIRARHSTSNGSKEAQIPKQTASGQAKPPITDMGAQQAAYQTKLGPFGHTFQSADQYGRPTKGRRLSGPSSTCRLIVTYQRRF